MERSRAKRGHKRFGMTALEEQVLTVLTKHKSTKKPIDNTAEELHITAHSVRMALYRLRIRYDRAVDFIEAYKSFRRHFPRRKYL